MERKGGMWKKMFCRGEPAGIRRREEILNTGTNPDNRQLSLESLFIHE